MNNFEQALKKLDRIEQNLKNQAKEIAKKDYRITGKDDRIAQLQSLFLGGSKILEKQYNYILQLKKDLEQESKAKGLSQEQSQHLQEDITRLDQESAELKEKVKELTSLDEESRKLRDQELQELKTQVANLTQMNANIQNVDQQVYAILEQFSNEPGLLPRSQKVVEMYQELVIKNKELETQLNNTKADLQKEKGWWDKWINDNASYNYYDSVPYSTVPSNKELGRFLAEKFPLHPSIANERFRIIFDMKCIVEYKRTTEKGVIFNFSRVGAFDKQKSVIKCISEYYKKGHY